jgi:hypothetical protein
MMPRFRWLLTFERLRYRSDAYTFVILKKQGEAHSKIMKGRVAPNKGKPMSEEQKIKISLLQKNMMWIYNPTTFHRTRINKTSIIPENYIRGKGNYGRS